MVFTAGDCVLLYDGLHTPLVSPLHIVQTFLCPDIVIYSNAVKHCVLAERDIVQWHSVKKLKYADVGLNQWTGHIFALKVESRGSVAKSFGFSLQKLGLTQNAFIKLRKVVTNCIRCYSICLLRKNYIWRSWETKSIRATISKCSQDERDSTGKSLLNESSDAFHGFDEVDIKMAHQGKQQEISCAVNYLNSLAQCLSIVVPQANYFIGGAYDEDVNLLSIYGSKIARELGNVFVAIKTDNVNHVTPRAMRNAIVELCHQFSGHLQQDSSEFLLFLFTWLLEDLMEGTALKVTLLKFTQLCSKFLPQHSWTLLVMVSSR